jgi:hypothetical protein
MIRSSRLGARAFFNVQLVRLMMALCGNITKKINKVNNFFKHYAVRHGFGLLFKKESRFV